MDVVALCQEVVSRLKPDRRSRRETPPFAFRLGSLLVETIGTARISKRRGSSGSCLFGPASFSSSIQESTSSLLSWLLLVMLVVSDESGGKMLWQDEADP